MNFLGFFTVYTILEYIYDFEPYGLLILTMVLVLAFYNNTPTGNG